MVPDDKPEEDRADPCSAEGELLARVEVDWVEYQRTGRSRPAAEFSDKVQALIAARHLAALGGQAAEVELAPRRREAGPAS